MNDNLILLSNLYNFYRKKSGYSNDSLNILVKILIIFGYKITFAGSALLKDSFLFEFFKEHKLLFDNGLIIPDMRKEVHSFHELSTYQNPINVKKAEEKSTLLDEVIKTVIPFSPDDVSIPFQKLVAETLLQFNHTIKLEREKDIILSCIEDLNNSISARKIDEIKDLPINNRMLLNDIIETYYCITGALVVGAEAYLPLRYMKVRYEYFDKNLNLLIPNSFIESEIIKNISRILAIDLSGLDILNDYDIINLRNDARIKNGLEEISLISKKLKEIDNLQYESFTDNEFNSIYFELKRHIEEEIKTLTKQEFKKNKYLVIGTNIGFDFVPIPTNTLLSILKWLRNKFSRNQDFKWAMYSPTKVLESFQLIKDSIIERKING